MATKVIFLTSGSTWTVPSDWNSLSNSIEIIGGGGKGAQAVAGSRSGGGGGSGGYSKTTNVVLTPASVVSIQFGPVNGDGSSTYDTWLKNNAGTVVVLAQAGASASGITGGAAAGTARAVGDVKIGGATGGNGVTTAARGGGGGGAGASGPNGIGKAGGAGSTSGGGGGGGGSDGGSSTSGSAGGTSGGNGGQGTSGSGQGIGAISSTSATVGTLGGGGGGGYNSIYRNATGGQEIIWTQTSDNSVAGPGGGTGGGGAVTGNADTGSDGCDYGGGSGGGSCTSSTIGGSCDGSKAIIVISYEIVTLTNNSTSGSVGTVTPNISLALTSNAATGLIGHLIVPGLANLTGNSAFCSIGNLAPDISIPIGGNFAISSIGTLTPTISISLLGNIGRTLLGTISTPLLPIFSIPIQESEYSFEDIFSIIRDETTGGLSRCRADLDNATIQATLNFVVDADSYDDLNAFWKYSSNRGTLPFFINLPIDNGNLEQQTAYFSAEGLKLSKIVGNNYTISTTVEIIQDVDTSEFDESVCMIYEASGGNPYSYLNAFERIIAAWPST